MSVVALLIGTCALAGCGPDLSGRADDIASTLKTQPGVADVSVQYANDMVGGTRLGLSVVLDDDAPDDAATNVAATTLAETGGHAFDRYSKKLEITQGDLTLEAEHSFLSASMKLWPGLKDLRSEVHGGPVHWKSEGVDPAVLNVFEVDDDPSEVLSATRDALHETNAELVIRGKDQPIWKVNIPFPEDVQEKLVTGLHDADAEVSSLTADERQVVRLSVVQDDTADAARSLERIIDEVEPSTTQPWELHWLEPDADSTGTTLNFWGQVSVGGCDYRSDAPEETAPAQELSTHAIAVRDYLRAKYDTCG